jgi:phosphoglycolate phosphatase
MKKYKLIIFDFDGTLVDTIEDIATYVNQILGIYGYPKHRIDEIKMAVGWGVHELLKCLEPELGANPQKLDEAVNLFKSMYLKNPVIKTNAYKGVRDVLDGALSGIKKAIVTNKPQDITVDILDRLKLAHHFEMVVGINSGFAPKPDAAATHEVIRRIGTSAENVVFIGDSGIDAQTSKNAGVDFGYVEYGYHRLDDETALYRFSEASQWSGLA